MWPRSFPSPWSASVKRRIPIMCLKDPHIVEIVDGGEDREGVPTSQRQALERIFSKRVVVDGRTYPTHRLAGKPTEWVLAPGEVMPQTDTFIAFEENHINADVSEERQAAWMAARDKMIAKSIESRRYAELQAEQAQSHDVAKVISQMVRNVAAQTTTPTKVTQRG